MNSLTPYLSHLKAYLLIIGFCLPYTLLSQTSINNGDCSVGIAIPDNNCVDVAINVTVTGTVLGQDVFLREVRLIVEHDWRADLEMTLSSPNAEGSIVLVDRRGGAADNWGLPIASDCSQPMILSTEGCASKTISSTNKDDFSVDRYEPENAFSDLYEGTTTNPNGAWNIRICDQKSQNIGSLQHIELVFEPEGCVPPTEVVSTDITASSVQLDWEDNNACMGSVVVEYGPVGFTPGNGLSPGAPNSQVAVLNCTDTYLLTGLQAVTDYDIYIRQSCSDFSYLYNSCKVTIQTDCDTPPTTLVENFDNQINCDEDGNGRCVPCLTLNGTWRNVTNDSIDWIVNSGRTATSKTGPLDDINGGGQYVYIESSFECKENKEAVLLSECIAINAAIGVCHLSFYYHMFGSDINQLKLEGTIDGSNWINLWQQNGNQGDDWFKVYIDLATYHNQAMQFRFVGTSTATKGPNGDIAIDQIEFYGSQAQSTEILYADRDNDGFGDPTDSISICFLTQTAGFVSNNQDCDDSNAAANPAAPELPCNLIDENCNGDADDTLILNPSVSVNEVCSGSAATIQLTGNPTGKIYWYDSPSGTMPIDSGTIFTTPILMDSVTYYFQEIKDSLDQFCQSGILSIDIPVNPQPSISNASGDQVVCQTTDFDLSDLIIQDANDATDTILFYSSDTYAPNSLIASNVSITNNIIYYIQAVGASGCTDELSVSFTIESSPIARINAPDTLALCFQSSPELLQVDNLGGGVAPLNYDWNIGVQDDEAIAFSGTKNSFREYSVTITSANGCSSEDAVMVHTLPSVSTIQVVDVQEPGFCQTNGAIQIAPQDGLGPYSYVWNGPSFGLASNSSTPIYNIPNLAMGAYNITVADSYGCTKTLPQQIVNGPDLSIDNITDVTCNGANNGAIFLSVGGLTNPTFQWTDGSNSIISTDEDLLNIPAGVYNVVVGSDNTQPCPLDSIVIKEPSALEILSVVTARPSCAGFQDGFIDVTVGGGTPLNSGDYSFDWTQGLPNIATPTGLSPGLYQTSITDANGCMITAAGFIEETPLLMITLNGVDPTCVDGDDGQLTVNPTGGTGPYSYQWNDPFTQNTATAFALKTAIYDVTVTDVNGCEKIGRDTLFQPAGMLANIQSITPPSCEGVADGIIDVEVTGGTAPYAYAWNTGVTIDRLTSILDGHYSVTITDDNDCEISLDSIPIESPSVMDITFINVQDPSCIGVDNGMIGVQVDGGIPPYRFAWNTNTGRENLTDLGEGSYFLTVTDDNNCRSFSDTISLTADQAIIIEEFLVVDSIACKGLDNGKVFMNVTSDGGGMAPYSFRWADSTLMTDASLGFWLSSDYTNLSTGEYAVEIKDNLGCTLVTSFELKEPDDLLIEELLIESPTCFGEEDGSVVAVTTGGNTPYTYNWTLPNNSVERTVQSFLQDVNGGDYLLQVIDDRGCISSVLPFSIQQPTPLQINLVTSESVQCSNPNEGALNISVTGGQMPYSYEWSSGLTARSITQLDAGTYTITTTDATECMSTQTFSVDFEENGLDVSLITIADKSCGNTSDGAVTVVVQGGQGIYQYTWSNGVQAIGNDTMTLTDLAAGTYSVTVVDDNDDFLCRGVLENIIINSGGSIRVELEQLNNELACFGDTDGFYNISVIGGAPPYNFQWNDGSSTEDRANLTAGTYNLTVTDINNCSWVSGNFFPPIKSSDNPLQIEEVDITPTLCAGENTGIIAVQITGGTQQYEYNWNTGATTSTIQDLSFGTYALTVTDRNKCQLVWDTTITQINAPMEVDIITQNLDCTTNSVGNIQTRVSCGQPPFQYRWSTGETTPNLSNISAGDYTLTITDANNDQSIQTITLSGPTAMQLNDAIVAYQNCSGIISLDITGGIPNSFIYEWRDATNQLISTAAIPTELIGGTYSVTVTDANNCSLSAGPFAVESVSPIELVESKVDFSAPSALGTVRVNTILGGTPPYSFTWTDLEGDIIGTDSILRGVPIGAYIVRVSDANGCEQTTDQLVTSTIDIAVLESLTVYPNPTNGTTLLDASFLEAVDVELELLDGMGQVVWRRSLSSVWELRTPISFVDLPTGVFFLKIRIGEYAAFGRRLIYLR